MDTAPCSGFLSINPRDRRHLATDDGRTWVALGANTAFVRAWQVADEGLCRLMGWIDRIAENGGNCARVWLSQPLLEVEQEAVGRFDQAAEERLLALLERARRRGVRLKLCLDHARTVEPKAQAELFPGAAVFHRQLWHPRHGGPAATFAEYFDGQAGRAHFLARARRLAAIAGEHPAVLGWELWNEVNAVSAGDWHAWTAAMLPAVQALVRQPVMQSFGGLEYPEALEQYRSAALPGNVIAQVHRYLNPGARLAAATGPMDLLAGDAVAQLAQLTGGDRPVLLSETGAVEAHHAAPSKLYARDREGTLLHDSLFAPFFAGACGAGQCWHWDHHYLDRHGLWWHLRRFADAVAGFDPAGSAPVRRDGPGMRVWQLDGAAGSAAWIRDTASDWRSELEQGVAPRLVTGAAWEPGLPAELLARASLRAYDPWLGSWHQLRAEGARVPLPPFLRSLVVRAERG
ncbi:MAG: hypothetical protein L6R48_24300 [Planctomycetes bacterium]|nr:hypothetical protein [Planctomycetota bacterium]